MNRLLGKTDVEVFISTLVFSIFVVLAGSLYTDWFSSLLSNLQGWITINLGWYYLLFVAVCLFMSFWALLGPYANLKLGKDDDKPEYSMFSWVAMLFSCGVGVGFIFWGVAEPLYHFIETPYLATPESAEAVTVALQVTYLHWGLHGYAIYTILGLGIAYFAFRLDKPMTVGISLYGILGESSVEGFWGKLINFITAIAAIAGISTSLGFAIMSMQYGFTHITGIEMSLPITVAILLVVIIMFITSAVTGLDRGIKMLSNFNVSLIILVLIFFLFAGPTRFLFNMMSDSLGHYITNFVFMTFWTDPVQEGPWLGWWTVFYWCWFIAFAPFTAGFIARISKGRTIRQFVVGSLFVAVGICLVWFNVIGGTAIYAYMNGFAPGLWEAVQINPGAGMFVLLNSYPLGKIISIVVFINLMTFIVTSADSASFFVAMIMSKGDLNPNTPMRILWGIVIGAFALILLISGGLRGVQTASIVLALPFSVVMIAGMISFVKALKKESRGS